MESFEEFFEKTVQDMPFTQGMIAYSTGIFISDQYWGVFSKFPPLFRDKINVTCKGVDDDRKIAINKQLIERCVSLAAAFLGYGSTGNGYKMPKTKVICDYQGLNTYQVTFVNSNNVTLVRDFQAPSEEAASEIGSQYGNVINITQTTTPYATYTHNRRTSWSHGIDLYFKQIIEEGGDDFMSLMNRIVHEMIHAKQTTTRRLSTSSGNFKWDGKPYEWENPEDEHDDDGYRKSPWEQEAYQKTPEIIAQIDSFLRTGVTKGFAPTRV